MQKHPTHKSTSGFTLIELLIVIAIIGIPQYTQYKIRGYDAHSKQALHDMHLLCNAYWLDTDALQGCDLPKIKETTYGFNQNADVVATLPPSPLNNFCASAKHNSSPNTYSIDSASLISSGTSCGGAGGSVQTASVSPEHTFEGYRPPEEACGKHSNPVPGLGPGWDGEGMARGVWTVVDQDGEQIASWVISNCRALCRDSEGDGLGNEPESRQDPVRLRCERGTKGVVIATPPYAPYREGHWTLEDNPYISQVNAMGSVHVAPKHGKVVYGGLFGTVRDGGCVPGWGASGSTYNFETGMWTNQRGETCKDGKRVE